MPTIRRAPLLTASGFFALFCVLLFYASVAPRPSGVQDAIDLKRFKVDEEEKVRSALADPDSARFRKDEVSTLHVAPVVCGEINFKNAVGGYRGYQRFIAGPALPAPHLLEDDWGRAEMDRLWAAWCAKP